MIPRKVAIPQQKFRGALVKFQRQKLGRPVNAEGKEMERLNQCLAFAIYELHLQIDYFFKKKIESKIKPLGSQSQIAPLPLGSHLSVLNQSAKCIPFTNYEMDFKSFVRFIYFFKVDACIVLDQFYRRVYSLLCKVEME